MENVTSGELLTAVLAVASGFVLLSNAAEKAAKAVRMFKAPNAIQDERLEKVESHLREVDEFLASDKKRLDALEVGNRATSKALLALLDHGIDGNNIKQMQDAKNELQSYLINR